MENMLYKKLKRSASKRLEQKRQRPSLVLSTRDNSMFKWQKKQVVGAFEVPSDPHLELYDEFIPMRLPHTEAFEAACEAWEELRLKKSFVEACESLPVVTACYGLVTDDAKTKIELVLHLNTVWAKVASEKLKDRGFTVDCYLWCWHILGGNGKKRIVLIRFHQIDD